MTNLETVLKEVEQWPAGEQIELVERLSDRLQLDKRRSNVVGTLVAPLRDKQT